MKRCLIGVVAIAGLLTTSAVASADTFAFFDLTIPNTALQPFPGPYAQVNIDLNSAGTVATFTITTDPGFLLGDGGTFGLNTTASATLGNFSGSGPFGPAQLSDGGSGNEDGFGSFSNSLNNFDGFADALHTISFTLTNTSGTWANAAAVLSPNGSGFLAAGHVFVCADTTCQNQAAGASQTGFAANGGLTPGSRPVTPVPEPASLLLLGTGLAVAGRRLRRKTA